MIYRARVVALIRWVRLITSAAQPVSQFFVSKLESRALLDGVTFKLRSFIFSSPSSRLPLILFSPYFIVVSFSTRLGSIASRATEFYKNTLATVIIAPPKSIRPILVLLSLDYQKTTATSSAGPTDFIAASFHVSIKFSH